MADTYTQGEARGWLQESFFERWASPEGWASITGLTEPPINWDNLQRESGSDKEPAPDSPYLEASVRHVDSRAATLGSVGARRFTQVGFVRVDFHVPLDGGMGLRDELERVLKYCLQPRRLDGDACGIVVDRVISREVGAGKTHFQSYMLAHFHYDSVE